MHVPRPAARPAELLEALGALLAAGSTPAAALSLLAAAGPSSARTARRIEESLREGSFANALARAALIDEEEAAVLTIGEQDGRLPAAIGWALARRADRRRRRLALLGAVLGPFLIVALGLLAEPLPLIAIGGLSAGTALRAPILRVAGLALLFFLPKLIRLTGAAPALRRLFARVPVARELIRRDDENQLAAILAAFADAQGLGSAPAVANRVLPARLADAMTAAAADPQCRSSVVSESLELVLLLGAARGELRERAAAFAREQEPALTGRLRLLVRALAYGLAVIIALRSAMGLFSMPIGSGLGPGAIDSSELKELERELDSIMR